MRTVLLFTTIIFTLNGCANQTTPTGGPQDKIPPLLVSSLPANNQKNFKGNKVELVFNEAIQLREAKEQIIITPTPGKEITFTAKKNTVTVEPEIEWKDSTTYSIIFRESVRDLTEANPALNLKLAFSTGPYIDSLSISGSVRQALSESIPENITIAIYQSDTFDIFKHSPSYFTKSNKLGKFRIENLKTGSYYVYAFDDKNKNLKVESTNEKYGFIGLPVNLQSNKDSISIVLIALDARPIKLNSARGSRQITTVRFNKGLTKYTAQLNKPHPTSNSYGTNQSEIVFYHYSPIPKNDSIPLQLTASDSLDQKFDSLIYLKESENKYSKDKFTVSIEAPVFDFETNTILIEGKTNKTIKKFIIDSLKITVDTLFTIPVLENEIENDSINHKFRITKKIERKSIPLQVKSLGLNYNKAFLISNEGDSSKQIKADLILSTLDELGILSVEIKTNSENFEVELLTTENKSIASFKNKHKHVFKNLIPREYKIRAYIDSNKNGRWDPGNIYERIEPEKTFFYQTPEKKFSFPIRANWELGPLILEF
jgi:Bacterial Ig-like domain